MCVCPQNDNWVFKNKDHGKISAIASLGLVTLWDVEGGLPQIDKCVFCLFICLLHVCVCLRVHVPYLVIE